MKKTIFVPDIECDSCVKLIDKKFSKQDGIAHTHFTDDSVTVTFDENAVKPEQLVETIRDCGFRASFDPFERKTFAERIRHYKENKNRYATERKGMMYMILLFVILTALEAIAYFGILRTIPNFIAKYGWWLLYLNISLASLGVAVWHFYTYKGKVTCMTGMMIGMTFGMQTGMMLGAIFGATNGFFIGAMIGMVLGVVIGALSGACGGTMGIMQGLMSGLMGGTMGPMITLMMFSDHLLLFMPFYMIVNVLIMFGLSYMVFEEIAEGKTVQKRAIDFITLASVVLIVAFVLIVIMLFGPKTALVA